MVYVALRLRRSQIYSKSSGTSSRNTGHRHADTYGADKGGVGWDGVGGLALAEVSDLQQSH
jgi:hypothetical protein